MVKDIISDHIGALFRVATVSLKNIMLSFYSSLFLWAAISLMSYAAL